jgi:3D (Asp-Asp-Asp) domain-containing protein
MCFRLTSLAGIFSVMLLLQTIVGAQNAAAEKIFKDNSNNLSGVEKRLDSSTLPVREPSSRGTSLPMPEGANVNPTLEFKLVPFELKLSQIFSTPEWSLSETRSFEATAYSLKGMTRSGVYVRRGVIAADPRVLPIGSVVQVTAGKYTGVYTVQDTGGKIKGHIIDVWVPSRREALQFGRQKVKVEVIKMGLTRLRR